MVIDILYIYLQHKTIKSQDYVPVNAKVTPIVRLIPFGKIFLRINNANL